MNAQVDHLVVVAPDLERGAAWCEETLGITPGPGGEHAFMGTHNRLFRIDSEDFPLAYFEIIAINPAAPAPARRRWFDMDAPALMASITRDGPQLAHFVARVPNLPAARAALAARGLATGEALAASRMTPRGELRWQISVREDGQRLLDGTMPTLIEWGPAHPAASMPPSGVRLESLAVRHPQAAALRGAFAGIGLHRVEVGEGDAGIRATLVTPRGRIVLDSTRPGAR